MKTQILICIGSGGVGKTSLAASIGYLLAKSNKKVLVLTIDPSRRLATTLGIEGKTEVTRVELPMGVSGELWASIVDPQKTFREFIENVSKKSGSTASNQSSLFENKLYKQLSTSLSGSQEFTSLEKLFSEYESQKYEYIILDTPPAKHAVDFLEAPQKMAALFNEGVAKWFRNPETLTGPVSIFQKILHTTTVKVLKTLEMLTGNEFIRELGGFFSSIEGWQSKLQARTVEMHRLLMGPQTKFCLVTSFDHAKLREAENLLKDIKRGGYNLKTIFINRAFPVWLSVAEQQAMEVCQPKEKTVALTNIFNLYLKMQTYYKEKLEMYNEFGLRLMKETLIFKIPQFDDDICDLSGLEKIANLIEGEARWKEIL